MSILGVYWSVMHRRPSDYDYFKRLNPAVVKIMDGGKPDYQWVRATLPGTTVLARDWALSEQHEDMRADPTGTGKRHAREWGAKAPQLDFDPSRTLVLGINEPRVWEPDMRAALVLYTVAFLDECTRLGLRAGALQLGVGWPANNGPDTPPDWSPYTPVLAAIQRGHHALVCHEYWADQGPGENWGWWGGRSLRCPWDAPIIIGECGVDMYVKDASVAHNSRGWQGRMSAERYAAELADYVSRMSADSRFVGCCVFASDFANREWASFDAEPAYQAILSTPIPEPVKPTKPGGYVPIVGGGPSQPKPPQEQTKMSIIEPRAAAAVLDVESGGEGFGADGRLKIRFETHIFKPRLGNDGLFARHFAQADSEPWAKPQYYRRSEGEPWQPIHTGDQAAEWAAFDLARELHAEAAYQSISMGAAQIMGFNANRVGYASALAMFRAFERSLGHQMIAFVNYILSDDDLYEAMLGHDWRTIARLYNGTGAVDHYAQLLAERYAQLG